MDIKFRGLNFCAITSNYVYLWVLIFVVIFAIIFLTLYSTILDTPMEYYVYACIDSLIFHQFHNLIIGLQVTTQANNPIASSDSCSSRGAESLYSPMLKEFRKHQR